MKKPKYSPWIEAWSDRLHAEIGAFLVEFERQYGGHRITDETPKPE